MHWYISFPWRLCVICPQPSCLYIKLNILIATFALYHQYNITGDICQQFIERRLTSQRDECGLRSRYVYISYGFVTSLYKEVKLSVLIQ